jgi:hypothetical protein
MELKEIVMRLVGAVEPVGKSRTDEVRLENLKALCALTESLVCIIDDVAMNQSRHEHSMKVAGEYALKFFDNLGIRE